MHYTQSITPNVQPDRIEKCDQNVTKYVGVYKKKVSNSLKINKLETCSRGANGNRTSDTRIFSPLLYQLSYGTICVLRCKVSFFS